MRRFTVNVCGLAPVYVNLEVTAESSEEAQSMGESILEDWKRGRRDLDWLPDLDGDIPDDSLIVTVVKGGDE